MKIAFDVKGTIDGPKGHIILVVFEELQKRGHECVVWSNSINFAFDAVKENDLEADFMSKKGKWDCDNNPDEYFDVAIEDDRSQIYLAAKRFIWVDEIETAGWLLNKILDETK